MVTFALSALSVIIPLSRWSCYDSVFSTTFNCLSVFLSFCLSLPIWFRSCTFSVPIFIHYTHGAELSPSEPVFFHSLHLFLSVRLGYASQFASWKLGDENPLRIGTSDSRCSRVERTKNTKKKRKKKKEDNRRYTSNNQITKYGHHRYRI